MLADIKQILRDYGISWFGRYYSVYEGVVVDNEDENFVGCLQVKVPKIAGEQVIKRWAFPRGMYCGKGIGLFAVPNVGDVVWVSFLEGDPAFPLWEYGWYGKGDVPTAAKNNGNKPTNAVWQSTSGHRIELDDKEGSEAVRVYNKDGHGMEINMNGVSIVTPSGKEIFLGSLDAAAEPAVLGDKNETALTDIKDTLDDIVTLLTQIASGDAAGVATAATFGITLNYVSLISSALAGLNAGVSTITTDIPQTKSDVVSLN